MRTRLYQVFVLALMLLVNSCLGSVIAAPTGRITIGMPADIKHLNPTDWSGYDNRTVGLHFVESLIMYDASFQSYEPVLATSWKYLNETTLQMSLRKNVKFHNGEAFNAKSAKASVELVFKTGPFFKGYAGSFQRVDIVDEYTINIISETPVPTMLVALALGSYQFPLSILESGGIEAWGKNPIGTGPFRFVRWVKDDHILLTANENYWGGVPKIKEIMIRPIPDEAARVAALEAGEVDIIQGVPISDVARINKNSKLRVERVDGMRLNFLMVDRINKGITTDSRVVLAIWHAINIQSIVDNLFGGYGYVMQGQLGTPAYFGYDPSLKPLEYNPAKSKQLLAEAGYNASNPPKITLRYSLGRYPMDKEIAEFISSELRKVGFIVTQIAYESGQFLTELYTVNRQLDIAFVGSTGGPDAHSTLARFWKGTANGYYNNPEFEQLEKEASTTVDVNKRMELYKKIWRILQENPPAIPLFIADYMFGVRKDISGYVPRVDQIVYLKGVAF